MKVYSYNVAGIRAREGHFWPWLKASDADAVLIQEIKAQEDNFPYALAAEHGYEAKIVGQKGFNGVAILTKDPCEVILDRLPGEDEDGQARYLEVAYHGIHLACLYLPNGNPIDDPIKWPYKLRWMARLRDRMAALLASETPALFGGDYNVCPTAQDIWDESANAQEAHVQPQTRAAWNAMLHLGMTEVRGPQNHDYTFWDFKSGRFQKDQGLNIDFMLATPQLADRLQEAGVDKDARAQKGEAKPSDHTPIWASFSK